MSITSRASQMLPLSELPAHLTASGCKAKRLRTYHYHKDAPGQGFPTNKPSLHVNSLCRGSPASRQAKASDDTQKWYWVNFQGLICQENSSLAQQKGSQSEAGEGESASTPKQGNLCDN